MEELRPSLTLYAYNVLGSYEEAKDVVQDVYLRFSQLAQERIEDKKSYLIRMVINLAIDEKRKQKKRLASYPGPWLPEPVATEDPQVALSRKEILSYSLLVLLEKLDPRQRAVFILKEAFDYDHEDIARVLGISVENSRKILSRARADLRVSLPVPSPKAQSDVLHLYLRAMEKGDMQELENLLNAGITVMSDGGGKAAAFRNIIEGVRPVRALLAGLHKKYQRVRSELAWINHQPAICYYDGDAIITCQIFSLHGKQFDHVFFMRNPEKLARLQKTSKKVVTFFGSSPSLVKNNYGKDIE